MRKQPEILWYNLYNNGNDYTIKGLFIQPQGILKGQTLKKFITRFKARTPDIALEMARRDYPGIKWSNEFIDPPVYLGHLPDEDGNTYND